VHDLAFHLRRLSARRLGIDGENPTDPRIRQRAEALESLAELLETEPELVAPAVRATIERHVVGPVPGDPSPPLGGHAERVLVGYGYGGATSTVTHLRLLERFVAAVQRDVWEMAEVAGTLDLDVGDLVAMIGLHRWEIDAAVAGVEPGEEYFARRAALSEDGRRALLERCCGVASPRDSAGCSGRDDRHRPEPGRIGGRAFGGSGVDPAAGPTARRVES
jgi:hypothetical protein